MSSYRRYLDDKREDGNPRSNLKILEDLYRTEYAQSAEKELGYLLRAYGTQFRVGKAHPAPSSAWRAERSLAPQEGEARFANRVHLFAGVRHFVANNDPNDHADGRTRRYLGYVSLRPRRYKTTSGKTYLRYTMVAMLLPPPYMAPPRYHILTCNAGSTDGILPFRATPFFIPATEKPNQSAPCMHASLHAALLLKAALFHCNSISSMEMVTLLWHMNHADDPDVNAGTGGDKLSFHEWVSKGLSLKQALAVLKHPAVRSGGVIEKVTKLPYRSSLPEEQGNALEALRCLTDYVANGIPVLLEITPKRPKPDEPQDGETYDGSAATSRKKRQRERVANAPDLRDMGHAILLIGMRMMADPDDVRWPLPDDGTADLQRIDWKELPSKFIIHDTFRGPYNLVSANYLLKAARVKRSAKYAKGKDTEAENDEGIRFLALLPVGTQLGIQSARDLARTEFGDAIAAKDRVRNYFPPYRRYLDDWIGRAAPLPETGPNANSSSQPRYICRLMRSRQILNHYLRSGPAQAHWPLDDPPALKNAKDVLLARLEHYQTLYDHEVADHLESEISKIDCQIESIALHWWCVEVRTPRQFNRLDENDEVSTTVYNTNDEERDDEERGQSSVPPFAVYCWPLNMKGEVTDAPIKIEYQAGDAATLTLRSERNAPVEQDRLPEERATFEQWRPSDG